MSKEPRIAARVSDQLRRRLNREIKKTNQKEAAILRAALEEFFVNHPTTSDKISAIVRGHTARAASRTKIKRAPLLAPLLPSKEATAAQPIRAEVHVPADATTA